MKSFLVRISIFLYLLSFYPSPATAEEPSFQTDKKKIAICCKSFCVARFAANTPP